MASAIATRRIQKELATIKSNPVDGVDVDVDSDDDLLHWTGSVKGAPDTPYKGGTFNFRLEFPDNFPFKAPTITFTTRIYHPGINEEGSICIAALRDEWKPSMTIASVLEMVYDKLNNPSPDDPFEPDIAAVLKDDKAKFDATAKEWTKKYASS